MTKVQITKGGCSLEWIYTIVRDSLDAYPELNEDLERIAAHLDAYAGSQISAKELGKPVEQFMEKSLRAFHLHDWESLRKEFVPTTDPRLAEISRLFSEPDNTENRALVLLKVWRLILELSKFKIHEPEPHWNSWRDCPEFVASLSNRGTING